MVWRLVLCFLLPLTLRAADEFVTFFTTYGYQEEKEWVIPVKLRVWEMGWKEKQSQQVTARLLAATFGEKDAEEDAATRKIAEGRLADFVSDHESGEEVSVRFEVLPEMTFSVMKGGEKAETDLHGRLDGEIRLPVASLTRLPADGWLSFEAVNGHQGSGRVRLLEKSGLSLISDIDDTVKITGILEGKSVVMKNTFLKPFQPAPGMRELYAGWSVASFHYVSGGPWQLHTPLREFLAENGFPEGSLHLRDFPLNPTSLQTWEKLPDQVADPNATFEHKVREISALMQRFPGRKFILVGDSGEKDPEVYREIQRLFGPQVQEIIIRDVAKAAALTPERVKGMRVIATE